MENEKIAKKEKVNMNCEKCIHYEACDLNGRMRGNNNPLMYDKECRLFKDKSLYIELPCKVGDKAYFVLDDGDEIYMCEGQINDVSTRGMFFSSLATEENCEDFSPKRKRKRLWQRGFYDRANERLRGYC